MRSSEKNNDHLETHDKKQMNPFHIRKAKDSVLIIVIRCLLSLCFVFFLLQHHVSAQRQHAYAKQTIDQLCVISSGIDRILYLLQLIDGFLQCCCGLIDLGLISVCIVHHGFCLTQYILQDGPARRCILLLRQLFCLFDQLCQCALIALQH